MDFIAKRIWYITIPTAVAVLVFQLYWLHNTYLNQHSNFKQTATATLQKAYDVAILETVAGHNYEQQTTNISITDRDMPKAAKTKGAKEVHKPSIPVLKEIKPTAVKIGSSDTEMGQLLSGILSMTLSAPLNPSLLKKSYQNELKNQGITIPFELVVYKKGAAIPHSSDANFVQTKAQGNIITARFAGVNKLLIVKIIWPIVLSFLLVMLITGCIWILWRIIDQQKKLEVMKNDFISNISHELKTPLSILNTTNDVLLNFEGMKNPEKTERYLNLSRKELQKLQHLIDNILDLTKMEHTDNKLGLLEKVNLEDLLKATISRFKELPGIDIELDLRINEKVIKTWPEALKTIVSNLMDNAIKYTSTSDKYIKIAVTEDQRFYWLSVIDHGIGIPDHQQAFIFDKFYRVPQGNVHDVKGYGLGLSHVKSLLSKMDAKISVSSKPMEGSVFTIQLKKMTDQIKLLLVEDEPILAAVVKETLEMKGFEVIHAINGLDGITEFFRFKPDLCIVDVMMPQKDGLSLITEIRTSDNHTPIIVLTAKSETQDVLKGFNAGADDYIKKPFSMEELLIRIQVLIKRTKTKQPVRNDQFYLGNYVFVPNRQELHHGGEVQRMSQREADILKRLAVNLNQITERREMLIELWGDDSFFNTRSMDVYITRLRKYLSYDANVQIVNIRGRGYKLIT